jgi:hypothetical protein
MWVIRTNKSFSNNQSPLLLTIKPSHKQKTSKAKQPRILDKD